MYRWKYIKDEIWKPVEYLEIRALRISSQVIALLDNFWQKSYLVDIIHAAFSVSDTIIDKT